MLALLALLAMGPAAAAETPPVLEVTLAPEVAVRQVRFSQRLTPALLAGYRSGALGLLRLGVLVYPASGRALPVLSDLGLFGSFSRSLKSNTLTSDGALAFSTQQSAWEAGARWRGLFSGEERLALSLSYASLRNDYGGAQLPDVLLPSGTLQYWRAGAEARFPFGAFALGAAAGALIPVTRNAIGAAFPRSTSKGVDVGIQGAYDLGQWAIKLSVKYTRFFYSLNPAPYDTYIAGGALDELYAVDLAAVLRL